MLPEDPVTRNDTLEKIRLVVSASRRVYERSGWQRLEQLFGTTVDAGAAPKKRISFWSSSCSVRGRPANCKWAISVNTDTIQPKF